MSIWDRLVLDERLLDHLRRAATHPGDAYLFAGPPGVGKTEAARTFAAAIVCPDGCGECSCCRRALRGLHPDVSWFEPEGFTYPLELIREMVAAAAQTPLEAARRVTVVEEAHRIAERSQNALLKALEEPNASVTWVLVADALEPFLPTVLSRCRVVAFSAVPEQEVRRTLGEGLGVAPERAELVVRAARGDLEQARALATGERVRKLRRLALDTVTSSGPSAHLAFAASELLQALAREAADEKEAAFAAELAALDEAAGTGRGSAGIRRRLGERHRRVLRRVESQTFVDFLGWVAAAVRDLAALSLGAGPDGVSAVDRMDDLERVAGRRSPAFWLAMVDTALAGQKAVLENALPSLAVESVLLALGGEGVGAVGGGATIGGPAGVAQR